MTNNKAVSITSIHGIAVVGVIAGRNADVALSMPHVDDANPTVFGDVVLS